MAEQWARNFFKELIDPQTVVRTRESLPSPPQGMEWVQDETTQQWKLIKMPSTSSTIILEDNKSNTKPPLVEPPPKVVPSSTTTQRQHPHHLDGGLPPRRENSISSRGQGSSSCKQLTPDTNDDWEWLSDRLGSAGSGVMVPRDTNCSVRSITTIEAVNHNNNNICSGLISVPAFKIQRTTSNSTIDSTDNILGPSGKGILGVDYVEHIVLPTDTLQGVCLSYKISSTKLKMANHFSGNSLSLAPKKLVIPISNTALRSGYLRVQDTDNKEYKLHAMIAELPELTHFEAKGYLELADWDLKAALRSAKSDSGTTAEEEEHEWNDIKKCKSGQIHIVSGKVVRGAGIFNNNNILQSGSFNDGTKSIPPHDLVHATPEHSQVGVELKSVVKQRSSS